MMRKHQQKHQQRGKDAETRESKQERQETWNEKEEDEGRCGEARPLTRYFALCSPEVRHSFMKMVNIWQQKRETHQTPFENLMAANIVRSLQTTAKKKRTKNFCPNILHVMLLHVFVGVCIVLKWFVTGDCYVCCNIRISQQIYDFRVLGCL